MKKPPDPGGSSCYSYSSYFYLAFYCSSAPNSCFSYYARTISLASRRNLDLLQSNLLSTLPSPVLKILSPTPALHCAVNLSIFVKEKSGKSNLLLYPPNTGAQPLRYGQEFLESKGGVQPCEFTFALFAADRIRVSSELSQQSHSYGPQKFLCTNDDVNLLSLLVFMVCEMEYINFVAMAMIPGE
ncbi:hypothetical protein Cgig2_030215 [Carnegiea gigantea]|uniref:Uncharacterized protein n=1 Tax=Carnegiea gigantea TaxID=171969 RepID=A0A9Q1JT90_9CARY|nr:hypothetical protein Cgig2_030215 [Carnegiea gigantea]